jgi:hypothetical protein
MSRVFLQRCPNGTVAKKPHQSAAAPACSRGHRRRAQAWGGLCCPPKPSWLPGKTLVEWPSLTRRCYQRLAGDSRGLGVAARTICPGPSSCVQIPRPCVSIPRSWECHTRPWGQIRDPGSGLVTLGADSGHWGQFREFLFLLQLL